MLAQINIIIWTAVRESDKKFQAMGRTSIFLVGCFKASMNTFLRFNR